jgi:shikimate kinase
MAKPCYLLGMMGSGKSYWAARMARRLHLPWYDLDLRLEEHTGSTVAGLFELPGEAGFRELERAELHRLASLPPGIVATGGGTPCFFDNVAWMNRHGLTIYLKVPISVLVDRLRGTARSRPLLRDWPEAEWAGRLADLERRREPFYRQAEVVMTWPGEEGVFERELEFVLRAWFEPDGS